MQALLKENFDEASFLYDLYKTYTITEINQFKWNLEESQRSVDLTMRQLIEDNSVDFNLISSDLVKLKQNLDQ